MSSTGPIDPYSPHFSKELESVIQNTAYLVQSKTPPKEITFSKHDQLNPSKVRSVLEFFLGSDIQGIKLVDETLSVSKEVFLKLDQILPEHPTANQVYQSYSLDSIHKESRNHDSIPQSKNPSNQRWVKAEIIIDVHSNDEPHLIKLKGKNKAVIKQEMAELYIFFGRRTGLFNVIDFSDLEGIKKHLTVRQIPFSITPGAEFYEKCQRDQVDPATVFENEDYHISLE